MKYWKLILGLFSILPNTGRGVPISELISDGNIGLLRAIEKFDESKDVKFISYAVWWIRQAMLESIKRRNAINFVEIEPNTDNDSSMDKKLIEDDEDDVSFNNDFSNENDEKSIEVSENQRNIITSLIRYQIENVILWKTITV